MQTTLTERGQISIPAEIRKKYQLKPGMGILWIEHGNGIFLMPVPEDPIAAFQKQPQKGATDLLLKSRRDDNLREARKFK